MKHGRMIAVFLLVVLFIFAARTGSSLADQPSYFDLRNVGGNNYVTSVKSQQGGTCWTHGAMASMEGNLLMTGNWAAAGEIGEPNLAEYHLDWWNGFNQHNNDDDPGGGGLIVHEGGDYLVTSAYLSRAEGAVRDIDGQSFGIPPDRYDPSYHYYYPRDIEWFVAGTDLSNINTIKNKIMTEGVMGTCVCMNDAFMDYNYYTHYQPPSSTIDPNHAVAIVGWNDYKNTQAPEGPGAWLIKNSWGTSWGLGGYFWISYYDKHCCKHPEMGAISFQNVEPLAYDHIYYHDYHGWRDTKEDCTEAFNAFIPTAGELLEAVSFYTAVDNVAYVVKIYDRFEGGELLDELSTKSGVIGYTGFHTIDLDAPVKLNQGDDFYIYLQLSDGGHAFDRTSEVPVLLGAKYRVTVQSAANPGESHYRSGSTWLDLYYSDVSFNTTANFCIKGLTTERGLRISPEDDLQSQGPVGGPFSPPSMAYQLENKDNDPVTYQVTADPISDWVTLSGDVSGTLQPDETSEVTVQINSNADTLNPGAHFATIYFINITDHAGDTTRQLLLLVGEPIVEYEWMLDSDLGWTTEWQWAFGQPTGGGGTQGVPDPTSGHTGNNVYGYNLNGDYENTLEERHLTSSPISCSGLFNVHLKFWRWLGVEQPRYDHAYVRVSNDLINWTTVWENPAEIGDVSWVEMNLDISEVADDQPSVYLRWTMGTTDGGWASCGWNIDDIQLTAYKNAVMCGDADADGMLNLGDILYLISYLYKNGPAPLCVPVTACGDMNVDGLVDIGDVIHLIGYLYNNGPAPGVPSR